MPGGQAQAGGEAACGEPRAGAGQAGAQARFGDRVRPESVIGLDRNTHTLVVSAVEIDCFRRHHPHPGTLAPCWVALPFKLHRRRFQDVNIDAGRYGHVAPARRCTTSPRSVASRAAFSAASRTPAAVVSSFPGFRESAPVCTAQETPIARHSPAWRDHRKPPARRPTGRARTGRATLHAPDPDRRPTGHQGAHEAGNGFRSGPRTPQSPRYAGRWTRPGSRPPSPRRSGRVRPARTRTIGKRPLSRR